MCQRQVNEGVPQEMNRFDGALSAEGFCSDQACAQSLFLCCCKSDRHVKHLLHNVGYGLCFVCLEILLNHHHLPVGGGFQIRCRILFCFGSRVHLEFTFLLLPEFLEFSLGCRLSLAELL